MKICFTQKLGSVIHPISLFFRTKTPSNFVFLLILFFSIIIPFQNLYGQGTSCATAEPFCTDSGADFPGGINNGLTADPGNNYDCLIQQPNAAWYYLEIDIGGNLIMDLSSNPAEDIDFIVWGPFADINDAQNNCGTLGVFPFSSVVDCSFDPAATETATINGAVAGEVYIFMITNFSNNPTDITVQTSGGSTGSTDCTIIQPPPPLTCGDIFTDGPGVYPNGNFTEYTICPTSPGDVVTLTFTQFLTENGFDFLTIYDGTDNSNLIGSFSGTTIPGPFTSTDASGCLFVTFSSDGSINNLGWEADVTCAPPCSPPSNDDCNSAISINEETSCNPTTGTLDCATGTTGGGANTCSGDDLNDVWYSFVAQSSNPTITATGQDDIVLSLYTNPCGNSGSNIDCQDGAYNGGQDTEEILSTGLNIGTTYYIRIHSFDDDNTPPSGAAADITVCVVGCLAPTNDFCANATNLTQTMNCTPTSGTVDCATDSGIPAQCGFPFEGNANDDVWYTFTATTNVPTIQLSSNFDGVVELFSGDCSGLTYLDCADAAGIGAVDEFQATNLTVGEVYYVRVYNYFTDPPADPTFDICIFGEPDDCGQSNTLGSVTNCDNCTPVNATAPGSLGGNQNIVVNADNCGPVTILVEYSFDWNQGDNINWIHGVSFDAGPNWTASQAIVPPGWIFIDGGVTGLCSGNDFGTGFFYEGFNNNPPDGSGDAMSPGCSCALPGVNELSTTDPSDNWGVDCEGGNCPTFSFELTFCPPLAGEQTFTENISFTVSEDGNSGGWCADGGCTVQNDFTITINSACGENADFEFDDFCEGAANGPTNISSPGGTFAFNPNPGGGVTIDPNTGVITGGVAGNTYTVEYTTEGSCVTLTSTQDVTVTPPPMPDLGPDIVQCEGDGPITIGVADDGTSTYQWSGGSTATTSMITIPDAVMSQTTYTLTITTNGCMGSDDINVTIDPPTDPTFNITDNYCEGDATDALPNTSDNGISGTWSPATIDNTTGNTYTFTPDAGECANTFDLTVTINSATDPTFNITDTYCEGDATDALPNTSDNGISGTWSPATIDNTTGNTYTFTPDAAECANTFDLTVTINSAADPTFNITDTYCEGDATDALPNTSDNGISGTWSPATIDNTTGNTYTFTPDAAECANTFDLTVTINTPTDPTFSITDTYCEGDATDALPNTSDNGISGTWSPATIDNTTGNTYSFTPDAGECANTFDLTVTINTPTDPTFSINTTYCVDDPGDALPTTSDNGVTGTWSPSTISTTSAGNTDYIFTPSAGCFAPFTLSVTVNDCGCADPTSVTASGDLTICEGETADISAVLGGSATSLSWTTSGDGSFDNTTSNNPTYTPGTSDIAAGTVTLTVTTDDPDGAGPCVESTDDVVITIDTPTDPTFNITDNYCEGDATDALPTTSDNGVTGTWSPTTINNTASGNYTFTPNAGQCANNFVLNVTINTPTDPTFNITDNYCEGETTDALPTTSDNGVTGTWSPTTIDNTTSGNYTFTPNAGQCANNFVLNVTINTPADPTFNINDTYCEGDATDALPTTSANGISGTWSPTTINNTTSDNYTFTPDAGQCGNTFTLNVTINPTTDPTFTITDNYCQGDATDALPNTSDNGIMGTWSPATIDNNAGGSYTFTPNAGQCTNNFVLTVTIDPPTDPTFTINDTYCEGETTDALPTTSDNGVTGTWSPTTIDNTTSGNYTFTPAAAECANNFTLNVTINSIVDPTFTINDTYCEGDATDALPTTSNNGITGTWSPTTIDNTTNGTYTFTPTTGQCANNFVLTVTVNAATDPTFTINDTYCAGDATDALPTTSDNGVMGTWSPANINNSTSGTYTFTPAATECANNFVLNVTINQPTDPTFSVNTTYCVGDTGDALPTTSDNGISGTWSPTTISTASSGNSSYTFTPDAGCFNPFTLTVTVNDCGCADPTSVTASGDFSICEGETASLSAVIGGSANTVTWTTAGDGSFDNTGATNPVYTPGANDIAAGSVIVTVTTDDPDGAGPCSASSDDVVITIDAPTDPTFTLTDTYCQGDATDALPATSDNGINGSWSPTTIDNTTSGAYTFTPTAGQCANSFTLNVTIDTPTDPTFSITDTYCEGETTNGLPTTSDNGITGTWSPATIDNTTNGTYTFTPTAGQCANTFVLNVTINTPVDPTFNINDTYCEGDATDALPTTSDNGFAGTWSPATINNLTSGNYTFTPNAGECANTFTLTVTIDAPIDPTFTINDNYCQGDATDALPASSNNGIDGTWSPASIDNTASGTYTFTPAATECANTFVLNVTIDTPTDPTFTITDTYCEGDAVDALPASSDNGITGSWSPANIDNTASGNYTFTPDAGQCANPFTLNVTIDAPTDPTFTITDTYCVGDAGDALPTTSDNGISGTWSPATISTATAGNTSYTFTPDAGCFNPFTISITVNDCGCMNPATVMAIADFSICEGETASLSATIGGSATTMTWSTTGDGSFDDMNSMTPVYTPGANDITAGSVIVTVTTDDPDGTGPCSAVSDDVLITIDAPIDANFTLTDNYCQGDATDALPTTSDNGINGTWSPATINNTTSGNYTFTPDAGECANPFTLNVTIDTPTNPTFTITDTYCEGDATDGLSSTSDNGINGTWSPNVIDNTASGTYTFTPNAGQCANDFVLNVTITQPTDPTFTITDNYCEGATTDALPTTSDNGINGSWSPSTIDNTADGTYTFTPDAGQCANDFVLNVTIDAPTNPTFTITDTYCEGDATDALPTVSNNGINGTWSPATIDNAASGGYTFTPDAGQCASPFTLNVTINAPTDPTFTINDTYCEGDATDVLPTTSDNGIMGTWAPSAINNTTSGSYTFTPTGCANPFTLSVTINAPTDPTFTITDTYCVDDAADALPTTSDNGIAGTWSPSSINTSGAGNSSYTFTPDAGCFNPFTISITVNDCGCMNPATVMAIDDFSICAGETAALSATLGGSAGSMIWSTAGSGSFDDIGAMNPVYTPSANDISNGFVTVTVTTDDPDGNGPCSAASDDVVITINVPADPTFTITNNYCEGDATDALPTTSDNGISGSWSPSTIDNTASGSYVFTPDAGVCANDFTLNVTIDAPTDPAFTINDTYCEGDAADGLPNTSDNGISGTWSPTTIDNTASGTYTFTPNAGQCANDFSLNVTVNTLVDPTFNITDNYCQGDTPNTLPTVSNNAVSGTWSPATINTSTSGSYTFTPDAGACANPFVLDVTIDTPTDPTFTITDNYCQGDTPDVLPTTSDNGISGSWSPANINTNADGSYVFTPDAGVCANTFILDVTIAQPVDPAFTITDTYCIDDVADVLPTTSNNGVSGTWSPASINTSTAGNASYTFTPNAGCFNPFTISITVNDCGCADPATVAANDDLTICEGETADLTATLGGSATTMTWTTTGDGSFDDDTNANPVYTPSANDIANGAVTVTVTTDDPDGAGPCSESSDDVVILIETPTDPTFTIIDNYCQGDTPDALPTTSDNGIAGTWSPATINTNADGAYVFTPDAGECANTFILDVTIEVPTDPAFTLTDTYCIDDMAQGLPMTSDNGVTGTWSPSTISTATAGNTTYTFTPDAGCFNEFTISITVNDCGCMNPATVDAINDFSICEGETASISVILGGSASSVTWTTNGDGTFDDDTSTTPVYTPGPDDIALGGCIVTATTDDPDGNGPCSAASDDIVIIINTPVNPTFSITDTYCVDDAADVLPTVSDDGISGTWSPATINTSTIGNAVYTFTPDGGCTNPFSISITVEDCGCANPATVMAMDDFNICTGSTADLSATIGGGATSLTWTTAGDGSFDDDTNANPVYTPGANDIANGTVTVTVTTDDPDGNGPCSAASDEVVISIGAPIDPTFTITDNYCEGDATDVLPTTSDNGIVGTWSPSTIDNTTSGTYTFTPNAGQCANSFILNVTIDTATDPTFTLTDNYCQGEMTDVLPTVSNNGINGTWSPATIDNNADGTYTFTPDAGQCANSFTLNVTIDAATDPTFTLTDNYCQNEVTDVLPTTSDNGITGSWSPSAINNMTSGMYTFTPDAGVCANSFTLNVTIDTPTDPTFTITDTYCIDDMADVLPTTSDNGIAGTWNPSTISTSGAGNTSYTFTPDAGCFNPFTIDIEVEDCGCPNPATITANTDFEICADETAALSATLGGSATAMTWTTAGDGTFDDDTNANPVYTPGANDIANGSVVVTVTTDDPDGAGPCSASSDDVVITINAPIQPTFTLTDNYCQGDATDALPTTSDNGVDGTWSPSVIDNQADGTYTFTPNAGACANSFTLNVTIDTPVDPTFMITDTYCQDDTTDGLPATSDNGIAGTWSPATIDNQADGTYTFTPDAGECANTFTLNVTITDFEDPDFNLTSTYCQGEVTDILPTTSDNGITGTWNPSTIDNQASGIYTFTPDVGCANLFTLIVTINNPTDPTFTITDTYCIDDMADVLPTTSNNGISGTWNPSTISTSGAGNTTYTFTPDAGCFNPFTIDIEVEDCGCPNPATITATTDFTICENETADLSAQLGGSASMMNWTTMGDGTFDNTTITNPVYTPGANDIANGSVIVTVTTDDPDAAGPCSAASDDVLLTINSLTSPTFTLTDTYCSGTATDALPTTSDNGVTGTWSPISISNMASGTYTFTPSANECANGFTINVTINDAPIVSNITEMCDQDGDTYIVSFTISGGDVNTYSVVGDNGSLVGNTFTSDPIADNAPYNFVVDDANGCNPTTVSGQFDCPDCPAITFNMTVSADISCFGENDGIAMVSNISSNTQPITFNWSNGDQNQEAENLAPGWQAVTVTDGDGCFGVDSIFLDEPVAISAQLVANDSPCFGDNNGSILFDTIIGGTAPYTYSIDGENFVNQSQFNFLSPGAYEIAVQDANGCMFEQDMTIAEPDQVFIDLGLDTIVNLGDSITLDPNYNLIVVDTFIWLGVDCINCPEVTVTPTEAMTVSLSIESLNGCLASDALFLGVKTDVEVFLPNVFSPNNDGANDLFYPFAGIGVEKINEFKIFDRWGEQVFQFFDFPPNDPTFGWNGTHKGKFMNPQVCVWYVEVLLKNGRTEIVKGDVTIVK